METTQNYKLSNKTIKAIVQLIQLGILTGTDISDQMRTMEVTINSEGQVDPTEDFMEMFESNLSKLEEMADAEHQG